MESTNDHIASGAGKCEEEANPHLSQADPDVSSNCDSSGGQCGCISRDDSIHDLPYTVGQDPSPLPPQLRAPGNHLGSSLAHARKPSSDTPNSPKMQSQEPAAVAVPLPDPFPSLAETDPIESPPQAGDTATEPRGHFVSGREIQRRNPAQGPGALDSGSAETYPRITSGNTTSRNRRTPVHQLHNFLGHQHRVPDWAYEHDRSRPVHQAWRAIVSVDGVKCGTGYGPSKCSASQAAASLALPWVSTRRTPSS